MAPAQAPKRPTNVSLDAALVDEAKRLDLNLSKVFEDRLREAVSEEKRRRWLKENEQAFSTYERFVERHGVFNEDERDW